MPVVSPTKSFNFNSNNLRSIFFLPLSVKSKETIYSTGCHKKIEKSNQLVWHKNKVELLFLVHPFCLITLTKTHPYNIKYTTTSKTKIYPIIKKSPWKAFWLSQGNYIFSFFLGHPVCQMSKNHLWVTTCQYPNYRKEKEGHF